MPRKLINLYTRSQGQGAPEPYPQVSGGGPAMGAKRIVVHRFGGRAPQGCRRALTCWNGCWRSSSPTIPA